MLLRVAPVSSSSCVISGVCAGESLGAQHRGSGKNNSLLVTFPFRTRHHAGASTVAFFLPDAAAAFLLHPQKRRTAPSLGSWGTVRHMNPHRARTLPRSPPALMSSFFFFFFFPSFLGSGLEGDKFLMFEKQLSHRRARERKQRRPPGSSPLCGHLISSANIKALALTCNCIASCELSSLFPLPSPPTLSLLTCSASSCYPSGSFFSSFLLLKRQSAS